MITNVKTHKKISMLEVPVVVMAAMPPPGSHSHLSLLEADGSQAPEVEIFQHDVCTLPYSSSTTSVSKGVMITDRNVVANLSQTLADLERAFVVGCIPNSEDHVVVRLMPFFHTYSIWVHVLEGQSGGHGQVCTHHILPSLRHNEVTTIYSCLYVAR